MRIGRKTAALGVVAGALVLGTPAAYAASGIAWSTDGGDRGASTTFNDNGDIYTVCDEDEDSMGAAGWIEVKQKDGSWKKYPKIYVGTGNGDCKGNNTDVTREGANLKVVACRQNGSTASPQDCGWIIISGS